MKAIVLDAEWAPRETAISPEDEARRWAYNANRVYRNPHFALEEVADPRGPDPDEVVVRVGVCGICGSDVHMYETDDAGYVLLPYHLRCPVVTGHELAGTVEEVGDAVTQFKPGDLVTVEEIQYCGSCLACRGGYPNQCEHIEDIGFTINGGFAEFVRVPAKACWSLNALLSRYDTVEQALEVGAMCEPVSVTYEAMFTRAGGFKPGGSVAVYGAGPIGLAAIALAAAAGASKVVCLETVPERRGLAEALGATHTADPRETDSVDLVREVTGGRGVAMAVECSGNFRAVMPAIEESLAVGGKVAVVGMDAQHPEVDLVRYQLRGAAIFGSVGHCGGWNFPNVIELMAAGRIQMEHAVTTRAGLDGMLSALAQMQSRTDGKVLIKPGEGA